MKKICFAALALFCSYYSWSQCTARPIPYTESFSSGVFSTCTPTTGGWSGTTSASQAGWWIPSPITNYAGGAAPEVEAYGNQANGGVSETISLTSPPINTASITSYTVQFKHNLYLTNSSASGSGSIGLKVETSQDKITWTQQYAASYNATPSLTSVMQETRTLQINGNTNDSIFVRFSITGVLFKVWGWEIDNFGVLSGTTSVQNLYGRSLTVAPNPFNESLKVNCAANENANILLQDILGNSVYEAQTNQGETVIDTRNLAPGVYLLRVSEKEGFQVHKVVKE